MTIITALALILRTHAAYPDVPVERVVVAERLRTECEERTTALRELQRSQNPERAAAQIAAAREAGKDIALADLQKASARIAILESENRALAASKRKLREALERAKEKR